MLSVEHNSVIALLNACEMKEEEGGIGGENIWVRCKIV